MMTQQNDKPKSSSTSDREIVITRTFDAKRELVFRAFTDAHELDQWYGPRGFTTSTKSMDFRVGGEWVYTMTHAQYGVFPNRVLYRVIVKNERLEYVHDSGIDNDPDGFEVTVTFEALSDGKTKVTQRSVMRSLEALQKVKAFGAVELGHETMEKCAEHLARASA